MKVYTTKDILEIEEKYKNAEKLSRSETIWFQNIPGTRKAGIKFLLDGHELREYVRCANSVEYFVDNFCKIKQLDGSIGRVELRDYQKEILKQFDNKYSIIFKSRQMGITAALCMLFLHFLLFNDNKSIILMANKGETAKEIMRKFKDIYKLLPFYLKQGVTCWNEKQIVFESGSRIQAMSRSIEPNPIYKEGDVIYIDEFSHIPQHIIVPIYLDIIKYMKESAKFIIASGPNGFNFFYDLIQRSELPSPHPDKNMFKTSRLYWWQVPGRQDTKFKFIDIKLNRYGITKERVLENLKDMGLDIYERIIGTDTYYFIKYVADNEKTHIWNIRQIDMNRVPLSDIAHITNWREEETAMVGGEAMFNQEYNLCFVADEKEYYKRFPDRIIFVKE